MSASATQGSYNKRAEQIKPKLQLSDESEFMVENVLVCAESSRGRRDTQAAAELTESLCSAAH